MNITVNFSDEDKCFIASSPDYPNIMTHGHTALQAIEELFDVIDWTEDNSNERINPRELENILRILIDSEDVMNWEATDKRETLRDIAKEVLDGRV